MSLLDAILLWLCDWIKVVRCLKWIFAELNEMPVWVYLDELQISLLLMFSYKNLQRPTSCYFLEIYCYCMYYVCIYEKKLQHEVISVEVVFSLLFYCSFQVNKWVTIEFSSFHVRLIL